MFTMTNFAKRGRLSISWRACILLVGLCCPFPVVSSYATDSITEIQQNKTKKFRGNVLDEAGAPVTGATVQIQGKAGGVITDIDGNFTIEVGESDVLQITFIGLETQLVPVRGKASMKIVMKELRDELEEVTVVAFAKQKKESVIGSIQTVKPAELKTPSSNLTTSLAGRMAGVIAYQRSGEPGKDNANFFIRGVTTFGYKKDPLILLDNVEVSSDDLARVQPDDIASFSVLKDATSTALYGARGANGVILVTTKEGKEGKAQVSVRVENSFSAPTKMIDIADPISYMRLNNEAVLTRDPQGVIPYPESKIANTMAPNRNPYVYPTVDWMKEMFKDYTVNQRVNFNVRGGGSVATYYLAGTFSNDTGLLKNDGLNNFNSNISLKKYNILSTFNIHLTKTTEVKVRFQADFDDYRGPVDGGNILFDHAIHASPVDFPKYYLPDLQNQGVGHPLFGNMEGANHINPYAIMTSGYKDYSRTNISAQAEIEQNLDFITEGLTVQGHFSTVRRSYFDVSRSYTPYYYKIGFYDKESDNYVLQALNPDSGTEYLGYSEGPKDVYTQIYMQAKANYVRKFGLHDVGALLVYQRKEELLGNAGSVIKSLPKRNQGISGRMSYGYDSRYFVEFNFGYNGSERFAQNERYGFFPSIGGAWMLSNEAFWRPIEKVANKLKLKVTYGLVGNDAIGSDSDRFFYLSNMNMNSSGRGQVFGTNWGNYKDGISTVRYPNEFITWEVAKKLNIGFELGLFNSLDVQFDYFREDRSKILMDRSFIPTTMGLEASVRANVGEAASHGVDLSVNYNHWFNNKIWLQGYGNFTYATSEFKVADEPDYAAAGLPWRSRVGYSLSQQWGYIAE
ncbi:TonB-dependent receptor, partial [Bacteroides thetaiotaomicron]